MYCGVLCLLRYVLYVVFVSLSYRPPMIFCSLQSLFRVGFLEISLETVYLTSGKDGKRLEKVENDGER